MAVDQSTRGSGLPRRVILAVLLGASLVAAAGGLVGLWRAAQAAQAARAAREERLVVLSAEAMAASLRGTLRVLRAAADEEPLRRAVLARNHGTLQASVQTIRQRDPRLDAVLLLDERGVSLADSLDPGRVGRSLRDGDFYERVLHSRAPYVSPAPSVDADPSTPSLALAAPVLTSQGHLIGLLVGYFRLDSLDRLFAPASNALSGHEEGDLYLVSPSGVILAHTDPAKRGTRVAIEDAGAQAALAGRRGRLTWTDGSERAQLSVFAPLSGPGWGLVYSRPAGSATWARPEALGGILMLLTGILGLALLGGAYVASAILRPLREIQGGMARLVGGDLAARVPESAAGLGRLATDFNRMAAALQERTSALEATLAERGASLQTANLELARASQMKSELLGRMSHGIRSPLNAIMGFADLLLMQQVGPLTDKQQRYLQQVTSASRQLLDLLNDMLDLARVEAGKLEIHPEPCEVASLLDETIALSRSPAQARRITLSVDIQPPLGELVVDRIRLQQIVHNLLSNAVKFTPEGGQVTLTARQVGLEVEVGVRDTGIGIPPEDQSRIFEAYERGGLSPGRSKASGLSLAVSKRLVDLHGGRIWVESAPGQGSTFFVRLPGAAPVEEGPEAGSSSRPLVLVIEDDLAAAAVIRSQLGSAGYRVAHVATGHAGLGAAKRLQPHAITLDLGLPDMDGWEVLYRLKGDPVMQGIPVLIVSAREEGQFGLSLGAVDYLAKPVDQDRLQAALQRCCELGTPRQRLRILVVDDEAVVLDAMQSLLAREGHEVLCAKDGASGLFQAEALQPDIVLLDLHLPDLSGFEVANQLRLIPGLEAVPIIAFSGKFVSPAERSLLTQQAVQFVGKYGPVTLKRLLGDLRRISALAN